jgi:hypothetical protein
MNCDDLLCLKQLIYKPLGLIINNVEADKESAAYKGTEFIINNHRIKFRVAKITPTKIGQFVTFYKRKGSGLIMPYESQDLFDFLIVVVRNKNHFGLFIFPKKVLCERGVVSTEQKEGKRAMRVYPSWDKTDNAQARKTQSWQLEWFTEIPENSAADLSLVQDLLS